MRIRGERECKDCGSRWTYYETGSVTCPECGSLYSVGVDDERTRHTDGAVDLDLSDLRDRLDVEPLHRVTDDAKAECREYVRSRGFIRAGDLVDLDDGYLAAAELLHAADVVGRRFDPDEREQLYLLELLRGADRGERPVVDAVPASMRGARGLAYAGAVDEYRRQVRTWLDDRDGDPAPAAREALGALDDHVRRVEALDGDVDPDTVERLVTAARDLADGLRDGDETALARASDRLERLV